MISVPSYDQYKTLANKVSILEEKLTLFMRMSHANKWLTREEVCRTLRISESTLDRLRQSGELSYTKGQRSIRFDADSVQAYAERRTTHKRTV